MIDKSIPGSESLANLASHVRTLLIIIMIIMIIIMIMMRKVTSGHFYHDPYDDNHDCDYDDSGGDHIVDGEATWM